MAISLADHFKEFLKLLNSTNVEYLLVGGYAVSYHGYPRATGDLDVWVNKTDDNAERMVSVINAFGFGFTKPQAEWFLEDHKIIRMGVPPFRIEILTDISGVSFTTAFAERIDAEIDGVPVSTISLARLRENKRAAGRNKDLNDLDHLASE